MQKQGNSMVKSIKLCVIGSGNFARYAHGPSLKQIAAGDSLFDLAAVADLDLSKAEFFAKQFGFKRFYGDWRVMLDTEKPDGVVVLTQVAATSEVASEVLLYGYPMMSEKPPGRNLDEVQRIIDASKASGKPAMCAFNRRYSPLLNQMLGILKDEKDETLEHVRCDFYRHERLDADFSTTSIHGIDALRHLSGGAYSSVDFTYQELNRQPAARNIFMSCQFDNGVYGFISFCPTTGAAFERYTMSTRHLLLIAQTVIPGGGSDKPGSIFVYKNGQLLRIEAATPNPLNSQDIYLAGYYSENLAFVTRLREGFPVFDDMRMSRDAGEIAKFLRKR